MSNIYHVPLLLLDQNFHHFLSKKLNLNLIQQEELKLLSETTGIVNGIKDRENIIINEELVNSWESFKTEAICKRIQKLNFSSAGLDMQIVMNLETSKNDSIMM